MKLKTIYVVILFSFVILFSYTAQQDESLVLKGPYLGQKPPGDTPELFAPGIISTGDLHSSLYFSPNGLEVYFSRLSKPEISGIYFMKELGGKWTKPRFVITSGDKGLTPYLSPDGKKLFCSISGSLCVLDKTPTGWSEPTKLGPVINFQKRQDGASVAESGALYFTTMFGSKDGMYRSEYANGKYSEPKKLDIQVNGNRILGYPVISPDERYVIFMSWTIQTGYGMNDLYISFRNINGKWGEPQNLGEKINTRYSESFPFVTRDGKYLFFNSNRPSSMNHESTEQFYGNIYWVDAQFLEKLKPKGVN